MNRIVEQNGTWLNKITKQIGIEQNGIEQDEIEQNRITEVRSFQSRILWKVFMRGHLKSLPLVVANNEHKLPIWPHNIRTLEPPQAREFDLYPLPAEGYVTCATNNRVILSGLTTASDPPITGILTAWTGV